MLGFEGQFHPSMLGFRGQFIGQNVDFCRFLSSARCLPVVNVFVVNIVCKQQKRENEDSQIGLSLRTREGGGWATPKTCNWSGSKLTLKNFRCFCPGRLCAGALMPLSVRYRARAGRA